MIIGVGVAVSLGSDSVCQIGLREIMRILYTGTIFMKELGRRCYDPVTMRMGTSEPMVKDLPPVVRVLSFSLSLLLCFVYNEKECLMKN